MSTLNGSARLRATRGDKRIPNAAIRNDVSRVPVPLAPPCDEGI